MAHVYLLASGPLGSRARAEAAVPLATCFDASDAFLPLNGRPPGVVLLVPETLPPADVVAVLLACTRAGADWTPVLLEVQEDDLVAMPVVPGPLHLVKELARLAGKGEGNVFLRPAEVIDEVRVVRHAINNPLSAALVETQLLLMDTTDEEARRALAVIQEQLRRIKELVATLHLPSPPRRVKRSP